MITRRSLSFGGLATGALAASGVGTQRTSAQSLAARKITFGIHNQNPWGYRNADGSISGIHPDMVRAILEPAGIKNIEFAIIEFGALIPSLISKRIDAVASGLAITPQRCEQVIFTNPDVAVGDGVIVKKGNPLNVHSFEDVAKNPAIRMGGGRGSTNTENAIRAGIPKDRVMLFQDNQAGIAALQTGRVDALTFSVGTTIGILQDPALQGSLERAMPFKGLIVDGKPAANYAAIAFRPEDAELRDLYNRGLAEKKADGSLKSLFAKYGFTDSEIAPDDVTAKDLCGSNYR